MRRKKGQWSYSAGEWGANRIRAFDRGPKGIYVEFYEETPTGRKRTRLALGTTDREAAKAKADTLALKFREQARPKTTELTLATMFEIYEREVTHSKSVGKQSHDRRCIEMFNCYFGCARVVKTLSRVEWDRFIFDRRSGGVGPRGVKGSRQVRDRVIAYDLCFLKAVANWATMAGDGTGGVLLERNPLRGLPMPREASPKRPALSADQYGAVRIAAAAVHGGSVELLVVLAHETGHRISSIRQLRWADVDLAHRQILWRGENDKIGFTHQTPLSDHAITALKAAKLERPAIADAWLFPSLGDASRPMTGDAAFNLWKRLAVKAGLPTGQRLGWHALRRQFASELKNTNLKDLCGLGGWKSEQTILTCYMKPDEATQRAALAARKPLTVASFG